MVEPITVSMATAISNMLFIFFTIISIPCISAVNKPKGFSTKLIHPKSPLSPYRNLKEEEDNLIDDKALKSSIRRHAYLSAKQQNDQPNDFFGYEFPDGVVYIAKLSIGDPPMDVFPMLDTASDLFWIQCAPCLVCYEQNGPIYNRSASSAYFDLPCQNPMCSALGPLSGGCNPEGDKCLYNLLYQDGSRSSGFLGADIINFTAFATNAPKQDFVVFGCGTQNLNNVRGYKHDGVMALGATNLSFFSQLINDTERKFSYCFGNLTNATDEGELNIGESAFILGNETPLVASGGLYYVNLTGIGIGVGQPLLPINWTSFQRQPDGSGGVMIDSGSTLVLLVQEAYDTFKKAVLDELRINHNVYPIYEGSRPCFLGTIGSEVAGFPNVILYLEGNDNKIELDIWSTFQPLSSGTDQFYCLAFSASPNRLSVIGNMAQQFHNVGFDLDNNVISFYRTTCQFDNVL